MKKRFRNITGSEFMRHNAIYFAGSMTVAFLNYLYHPLLSRFLSVRHFGEVQAVLSLSLGIGIILSVLGTVAVTIVANKEHEPERESALGDLQSFGYWMSALAALIILLFGTKLTSSLQFDSTLPFLALAAILATTVPLTFRRSYLQAHKDFASVSINSAIVAACKIAAAIGLVIIGLGAFGALGGYVIAQIIGIVHLIRKTRGIETLRFKIRLSFTPLLRQELRYGFFVLLATGFIAFITSFDVVFAKFYLDPDTAGLYSGISTVARIIYFATSSIAGVLIASLRIRDIEENTRTFLKALTLLLILGGAILASFTFFPIFFIRIFLGVKFTELAPLLPLLSIATFCASIANLFFFYFLALRIRSCGYAAAGGIAATLMYIFRFHDGPEDIVKAFILGSASSAIILVALFIFHRKHGSFERNKKSQDNKSHSPGIQRAGEPADLLPRSFARYRSAAVRF